MTYTPREFDRVVIHATGEAGTVVDEHRMCYCQCVEVELDTPRGDEAVIRVSWSGLGPLIRDPRPLEKELHP